MRFALAALLILLSGPAMAACEIGGPNPWKEEDDCSSAAHALMERIGGCLSLADADTSTKKKSAATKLARARMACDKLECDYKANKSDHDMVEDYVQRYFTDEKEFLLTFPAAKSCTPPVKKKPAKKPAPSLKTKAKTEVKTKAKTDVKTKAKTTATPKTKPTPKPTPKKVTPQEN